MWKWIKQAMRTGPNGPRDGAHGAERQRAAEAVTTAADPGRYRSLFKYLENRYADVVVLTFAQIEDLLGFALPELARTQPGWWTGTDTPVDGPPHSGAWVLAGRTASPNLLARIVVFERA